MDLDSRKLSIPYEIHYRWFKYYPTFEEMEEGANTSLFESRPPRQILHRAADFLIIFTLMLIVPILTSFFTGNIMGRQMLSFLVSLVGAGAVASTINLYTLNRVIEFTMFEQRIRILAMVKEAAFYDHVRSKTAPISRNNTTH